MARLLLSAHDPDPTLVVGPDGVWRYRGDPIRHTKSLRLFKSNLRPPKPAKAKEGNPPWRTHWGKSSLKVVIEGPPLVVRHLKKTGGSGWLAVLDSGQEPHLALEDFCVVGEHLAANIGGVLAILGGEAVSAVMAHLEETSGGVFALQGHPLPRHAHWNMTC